MSEIIKKLQEQRNRLIAQGARHFGRRRKRSIVSG